MDVFEFTATTVILVAAFGLFLSGKMRVDLVAICVLVGLLVFGLVTPEQGLSGFGNPATITIGAMFVVGAGLVKTGILQHAARWIDRLAGKGETRLVFVLCVITAVLSAFLVNTATVAILIPVVITLAAKRNIASSKILIPLSYASQFGGVCTLIGTSTNMLVNGIGISRGLPSFTFFEFAPLGLVMVAFGLLYLTTAGKYLLPKRKGETGQVDKYRLADYEAELMVLGDSPLAGKTWEENGVAKETKTKLVTLIREGKEVTRPPKTKIRPGDLLLIHGHIEEIINLENTYGLEMLANTRNNKQDKNGVRLVEVLVPPDSNIIGKTMNQASIIRNSTQAVLAIQRRGSAIKERVGDIRLESGDTLLVQGHDEDVHKLINSRNVIVTSELSDLTFRKDKAIAAVIVMALVIVLSLTGIVPVMVAAVIGALGMVVTRCVSAEEAYASIDWKIIFLLAGIIPLGIAMETSGIIGWLVDGVLSPLISFGPLAVLSALYFVVAVLTEGMSSNALAAIMAPVAFSIAAAMDVDPRPFLVAITFAASTSFATPIGYQTNTMVYSAGGYRFSDFARIGIPLNIVYWGLTVLLIPIFWPF